MKKRHLLALGLIVLLIVALFGLLYFGFAGDDDTLVLVIGRTAGEFEFWVDPVFWDQGDPSLLIKLAGHADPNSEVIANLGSLPEWFPEKQLDIRQERVGHLITAVIEGVSTKPVLIWDPRTDSYAPESRSSTNDQAWLSEALDEIAEHLRSPVCLGHLWSGEVVCRHDSPVSGAAGKTESSSVP